MVLVVIVLVAVSGSSLRRVVPAPGWAVQDDLAADRLDAVL